MKTRSESNNRWWVLPVLVVGTAYLLRTLTLEWQSTWLDEVHAIYFVNRSFMDMVRLVVSPEHNGPLYYVLLWVWHNLTGLSDFALRYFSTLCSVLTVAALWRVARDWFGRRVATWAAALFAVAPFAIWFAQEIKMYALHMLLAMVTTLLLVKALRHNRWYLWLGYGVTLNLLVYSHLFGALAVAAQGIAVVLTTWRAWRVLRSYIVTMVLVALFYAPVIAFALRVLPGFELQDISKGFMPLPHILREVGAEYVLRLSILYVTHPWRLLAPLAFLLVCGLFAAWRRGRSQGVWVTVLLLLPLVIFYPISFRIPVFAPKYISAIFPFFILTLALALETLRRWWKPLAHAGFLGMLVVAVWANGRILTQPVFQRADWRAVADYLQVHADPQDAVVGFADYIHRPIQRYYAGPAHVYRFQGNPYEPEAFYNGLRDAGHLTLWLILHQDGAMAPGHRLREAAAAMYPQVTAIYPNGGQITVLGYSMAWRHTALPAKATPLAARFDNGLALAGYWVDATRLPPTERLLHPPSNWIHVITYWQVWDSAPPLDFEPFVRLVDAQGGVWGGELPRPPTVLHFDPPERWEPGDIIEMHFDVNLNPVTPPGIYRLIVGLEREDGVPVPLEDEAASVYLRDIEITRR